MCHLCRLSMVGRNHGQIDANAAPPRDRASVLEAAARVAAFVERGAFNDAFGVLFDRQLFTATPNVWLVPPANSLSEG